jgi:hypothetical protein
MAKVKLFDEKATLLGLGELSNDGSLIASKSVLGNVIVGDNIAVDSNGTISVPQANGETLGVVKVGSGLSINNTNGALESSIIVDLEEKIVQDTGYIIFATEDDLKKSLNAIYGHTLIFGRWGDEKQGISNGFQMFGSVVFKQDTGHTFNGNNPISDFDLTTSIIFRMNIDSNSLVIKGEQVLLEYPQTNE